MPSWDIRVIISTCWSWKNNPYMRSTEKETWVTSSETICVTTMTSRRVKCVQEPRTCPPVAQLQSVRDEMVGNTLSLCPRILLPFLFAFLLLTRTYVSERRLTFFFSLLHGFSKATSLWKSFENNLQLSALIRHTSYSWKGPIVAHGAFSPEERRRRRRKSSVFLWMRQCFDVALKP